MLKSYNKKKYKIQTQTNRGREINQKKAIKDDINKIRKKQEVSTN